MKRVLPPRRPPARSSRPRFVPALVLVLGLLSGLLAGAVRAETVRRGLLSRVFARLLDETKAEVAVGALLADALRLEFEVLPPASHPAALQALAEVGERAERRLNYTLHVINTNMLLDVALPGGPIVVSAGLLELASDPLALEFILGRNVALIAERQPMTLLKSEGLYAAALRQAKRPANRRLPEVSRDLLRSYLKASEQMNHAQADRLALTAFGAKPGLAAAARRLLAALLAQTRARAPWEAAPYEHRLRALPAETAQP